ncbi:helix-turn-helix domain-containing protein [Acidovorax sp. D2M1]|uniref:Helix-turn-helix domain-containing protein n=1 Tax=Acidovorax benzenivorans TaxID=2987520 RepID=A0ABT5RR97_9BURK|nr:helix-turn-helix domain-containing protein [Acidovorax benzenivorans]MDD2176235.1 helix-turn-helix domain-containing protein [Acidovorax benzenivorans]
MDSLISAAARALAAGDALAALQRVALRDDPPALALRGIAMAQLGEHPRARELLRRAARGFGAHEPVARARCVVAEAEVALAMRDLGEQAHALMAAVATLQVHGDVANALQARLVAARKLILLGRLNEATAALAGAPTTGATTRLPPSLIAVAELAAAELALRSLHIGTARLALQRAQQAAAQSGVPALLAEVAQAHALLTQPAACCLASGAEHMLPLDDVAALLASPTLVVDACRHGVRAGDVWEPLARRPVLFALVRALATAWPGDVDREALIANVFRTRHPDETHRARLRVEIGRLRKLIAPLANVEATARGFVLRPHGGRDVAVLAPPVEGEQGALLALLADGAAWSTSALALALGDSQRTVQRALADLEAADRVRAIGNARARRWLAAPLVGFTTILLLPTAQPIP